MTTTTWYWLLALCPRRVLRVIDAVALCVGLTACGGAVEPADDGGKVVAADAYTEAGVATTRLCYLKFQPGMTPRSCSTSDDWTWTDDAGIHDCVDDPCPLAGSCDVGGIVGTCR